MSNDSPIKLEQLFRYYKALPHQQAAVQMLEQDLAQNGYAAAMRRDRAWFQTWSQAGKQLDLSAVIKLIREFEGLALLAYPDPLTKADPWTIGYGTTKYPDGRPVREGDRITSAEADQLLRVAVDRVAARLEQTVPYWSAMSGEQRCALISFAYNLGAGFYGAQGFDTISRVLAERQWSQVPDAMLLYRNPGTDVEAGLRRRREAEGALWRAGLRSGSVLLNVPYEYQLDNATGKGYRECFSSTCAMLARYYGKIRNDDEYNKIRTKHGDTTSSAAQVAALQSLGLRPVFRTNGTVALLEQQLLAGRPVGVGWLHLGSASKPTGHGHWSLVIGTDATHIVHHDPNGEADLVNGGYASHDAKRGRAIRYSRKNWLPRWLPDGPNQGWMLYIDA